MTRAKRMRVEGMICQVRISLTREELSQANLTGGLFQSLKQQIRTIRQNILGNATAKAAAFQPLKRSLETVLTRLSRTNARSKKSKKDIKKTRWYKDESDGCIDTWIEVIKLHFEERDLTERQKCSALSIKMEGTALNCVEAKKQYQRDTA